MKHSTKRHGNLVLNEGDFGSILTEHGNKYFLRFRSFVSLQTGELLTNAAGEPERRSQKALIATQDDKFTSEKSPAVVTLASQLRRRIIALEEAKVNGLVTGSVTAAQPESIKANPDMSISTFFETVFLPKKEPFTKTGQLAQVTFDTFKNYWRMFLKKHFNGVQTFRTYTQQKALAFLEELRREDGTPYGQNTVTKIRFVAVEIFKEAVKRGYTDENPWIGIKVSDIATNAAAKGDAYTEAEVIALIRNLDAELGDTSKPLVEFRDSNIRNAQVALAIGFWAGCRPSEIEALDWSNVDLALGTIFVCESIVNGTHAARTKTGSRDKDGSRLISYLSPLAPILQAWHKRAGSPTSGLVLQKDGKPVSLRRLGNEIIKPVAEKHGLRFSGIYGCRRGLGTHLVNIGVSIEYGAEMLGNTVAIFEAHYWNRNGKGSAKAAEIDRMHRLAQAKAAEAAGEQKLLVALGAGEGQ